MATNSKIEWCEATWNPVTGCSAVSPGCTHCYAATMSRRLEGMGQEKYTGINGPHHFNGTIKLHHDLLEIPIRRRKPTTYFVNSMSDLFHEGVSPEFILDVFSVMRYCHWHQFIVLTKRSKRMSEILTGPDVPDEVNDNIYVEQMAEDVLSARGEFDPNERRKGDIRSLGFTWPLANVCLGVSAENQEQFDARVPHLLATPAAVWMVSCEPLLGPINFAKVHPNGFTRDDLRGTQGFTSESTIRKHDGYPKLDWVIVGGESGPGARPMHPDWARSIRDQCVAAGVPFFFKQWGAWHPSCDYYDDTQERENALDGKHILLTDDGYEWVVGDPTKRDQRHDGQPPDGTYVMHHYGKKAGRLLDGREWNERPKLWEAMDPRRDGTTA